MTVQIGGVRNSFGARVVLDSVDLSAERGGIVVLLGPDGAGKTTLLKIVATLLRGAGPDFFRWHEAPPGPGADLAREAGSSAPVYALYTKDAG